MSDEQKLKDKPPPVIVVKPKPKKGIQAEFEHTFHKTKKGQELFLNGLKK